MPLPLPQLDDRRWVDLVEEGRSLIPLYAPGWTDHNVHDPGITLVELLAWMAEMDLYRLNRVPASHLRKLLALVGIVPLPPRGARTVLAVRPARGAPRADLPADLEVEAQDLDGRWTVFTTLTAVSAVHLDLQAVQVGGPRGIEDLTARWRRGETVPLLGEDPAPGAALYLGFDRPLPAGVPVTLYVRFAGGHSGEDEVLPPHASARTAWEIQIAPGVWQRLDATAGEIADETRSLTLDGRVVVTAPVAAVPARVGSVKAPLHYLRCVLVGGALDAAPELTVLVVNGVTAEQREAVAGPIGTGDGEPAQQLSLAKPAVHRGEIAVTVTEDGSPVEWTARPDFDLSGRAGSHFVLDAEQGRLTFGDGEAGRRLPAGAPVSARYSSTRGAEGNLPAGRPWRIASLAATMADLANPVPAEGGAAAETLASAAARAVDAVEQPSRAVTLADYEALALATPGVRLARVAARANLDPVLPCLQATGVVTVILLPFLPRRRPFPSAGTRSAVARFLARRRPIGTRIAVAGPEYLEIAVRAAVRPFPGVDPAALRERITAALDRFFHPLTGGPDGTGWPFGRDVYRSEVLQLLDEVPGVDHVLALELAAGCGCHGPVCGNVCVGPLGLVASGRHEITIG